MTRPERAADVNQMRRSDLKDREGGARAELDKLWNDNPAGTRTSAGRSDFNIHIKSSIYTHTHTHTMGSSKQRQHCGPRVWKYFPRSGKFSFAAPLIYCTGAFYVCGGHNPQSAVMQYLVLSLHVGWCYWKLSGSFLCEHCCSGLGPGPARGLVLHCSALAWPQSAFLSHGPWPPDAFPDPGNRINTSARALGSHSRIHSCPLARPGPVRPS